jgi:hypothetical protein
MTYVKPEVLAQNGKQGVFAAGCATKDHYTCSNCELSV